MHSEWGSGQAGALHLESAVLQKRVELYKQHKCTKFRRLTAPPPPESPAIRSKRSRFVHNNLQLVWRIWCCHLNLVLTSWCRGSSHTNWYGECGPSSWSGESSNQVCENWENGKFVDELRNLQSACDSPAISSRTEALLLLLSVWFLHEFLLAPLHSLNSIGRCGRCHPTRMTTGEWQLENDSWTQPVRNLMRWNLQPQQNFPIFLLRRVSWEQNNKFCSWGLIPMPLSPQLCFGPSQCSSSCHSSVARQVRAYNSEFDSTCNLYVYLKERLSEPRSDFDKCFRFVVRVVKSSIWIVNWFQLSVASHWRPWFGSEFALPFRKIAKAKHQRQTNLSMDKKYTHTHTLVHVTKQTRKQQTFTEWNLDEGRECVPSGQLRSVRVSSPLWSRNPPESDRNGNCRSRLSWKSSSRAHFSSCRCWCERSTHLWQIRRKLFGSVKEQSWRCFGMKNFPFRSDSWSGRNRRTQDSHRLETPQGMINVFVHETSWKHRSHLLWEKNKS